MLWPHVIAPKDFSLLALPGVETFLLPGVRSHFSGAITLPGAGATDHFAKMGAQKKKVPGGGPFRWIMEIWGILRNSEEF